MLSNGVVENCPNIPDGDFTDPPKAMLSEQYKTQSVVESYRNYYIGEKKVIL